MGYCSRCGHERLDWEKRCSACGFKASEEKCYEGGILWGLLGVFFPAFGLALYLIWKDFRPQGGKWAGIGAIVSAIWHIAMFF